MDSAAVATLTDSLIGDVGDTLISALPAVLGVVGALIGFFFVIRFITRKVGGARR